MLWLIGAGPLAVEYSKVLDALRIKYSVIGRGKKSAEKFSSTTGQQAFVGGLSNFLKTKPTVVPKVIGWLAYNLLLTPFKGTIIES